MGVLFCCFNLLCAMWEEGVKVSQCRVHFLSHRQVHSGWFIGKGGQFLRGKLLVLRTEDITGVHGIWGGLA